MTAIRANRRGRRPGRPANATGGIGGDAMDISPDRRSMRLTLAVLLVGSGILSGASHAALPAPGCKDSQGQGFTYVGTVNPGSVIESGRPPGVPPVDVGAISIVTTDGPGGSREVAVHGGNLDVVHFGAGLSQLFTGTAGIDAFVHAEIGSIHLTE